MHPLQDLGSGYLVAALPLCQDDPKNPTAMAVPLVAVTRRSCVLLFCFGRKRNAKTIICGALSPQVGNGLSVSSSRPRGLARDCRQALCRYCTRWYKFRRSRPRKFPYISVGHPACLGPNDRVELLFRRAAPYLTGDDSRPAGVILPDRRTMGTCRSNVSFVRSKLVEEKKRENQSRNEG